jgi:hypothetical protein
MDVILGSFLEIGSQQPQILAILSVLTAFYYQCLSAFAKSILTFCISSFLGEQTLDVYVFEFLEVLVIALPPY